MPSTLHPTTATRIAQLTTNLPQALILHGDSGVGLLHIAKIIANNHLVRVLSPEPTNEKSSVTSISVEQVRTLHEQTRGIATKRQVIIIDDADTMTQSAQNAFLKLLEEPNANTHFILTTHTFGALLPTIQSRTEHHYIPRCTPEQSKALIEEHTSDPSLMGQLLFIANGRPAQLLRYLQTPTSLKSDALIYKDAKQFTQTTSRYQKQKMVSVYAKDRATAQKFISTLLTMLEFIIKSQPSHSYIQTIEVLLSIQDNLAKNANVKLQLERLVV